MARPPSTGRIFITPLVVAISCSSTLPATSALAPISLSGLLPLFSMVRKPPPILAPPGVARVQACVITRSPALTSSARADVAIRAAVMASKVAVRLSESMGVLIFVMNQFGYLSLLNRPLFEVGDFGRSLDGGDVSVTRNQH